VEFSGRGFGVPAVLDDGREIWLRARMLFVFVGCLLICTAQIRASSSFSLKLSHHLSRVSCFVQERHYRT
jgi:hypothetical protein